MSEARVTVEMDQAVRVGAEAFGAGVEGHGVTARAAFHAEIVPIMSGDTSGDWFDVFGTDSARSTLSADAVTPVSASVCAGCTSVEK